MAYAVRAAATNSGGARTKSTANEILRAAGTVDEGPGTQLNGSPLVVTVVMPALAQAERAFASTLGAINLDDLIKCAEKSELS